MAGSHGWLLLLEQFVKVRSACPGELPREVVSARFEKCLRPHPSATARTEISVLLLQRALEE